MNMLISLFIWGETFGMVQADTDFLELICPPYSITFSTLEF